MIIAKLQESRAKEGEKVADSAGQRETGSCRNAGTRNHWQDCKVRKGREVEPCILQTLSSILAKGTNHGYHTEATRLMGL